MELPNGTPLGERVDPCGVHAVSPATMPYPRTRRMPGRVVRNRMNLRACPSTDRPICNRCGPLPLHRRPARVPLPI